MDTLREILYCIQKGCILLSKTQIWNMKTRQFLLRGDVKIKKSGIRDFVPIGGGRGGQHNSLSQLRKSRCFWS